MEGIDVSQWQGPVDFEAVGRAGIELVYLKASEGENFVDPFFYRNYANAKNAGLSVGFYHYLKARSADSARREACHLIRVTEGLVGEARPVLDLEDLAGLTGAELKETALAFLLGVEWYSNQSPAIYADAQTVALLDPVFAAWPLWIARYGAGAPGEVCPWTDWAGWQYTDRGRVAGIQGNVDRDLFKEAMLSRSAEAVAFRGEKPACRAGEPGGCLYRARAGDTLSAIALRHGVTPEALVGCNRGVSPNLIYEGQLFWIPSDGCTKR